MKKTLAILMLGAVPALAFAAGGHGGGHDLPAHGGSGHDMAAMSKTSAAAGQPGDPSRASRTIELLMDDTMRFTPSEIEVQPGETVRFLVRNAGRLPHEMVIGSVAELKAHAAEMREAPGLEHAEPNMITLGAGQHGDLVWQFDKAGTVDFACLIPGHMEAGMVGRVRVG
nr:cupredoxin family protein [Pollutimonas bauzanensis]